MFVSCISKLRALHFDGPPTKQNPETKLPMKPTLKTLAASSAVIFALTFTNLASAQVHNTKTGANALAGITTGSDNTADGFSALKLTSVGGRNTGIGSLTLTSNTSGTSNTAVGYAALADNVANGNT